MWTSYFGRWYILRSLLTGCLRDYRIGVRVYLRCIIIMLAFIALFCFRILLLSCMLVVVNEGFEWGELKSWKLEGDFRIFWDERKLLGYWVGFIMEWKGWNNFE